MVAMASMSSPSLSITPCEEAASCSGGIVQIGASRPFSLPSLMKPPSRSRLASHAFFAPVPIHCSSSSAIATVSDFEKEEEKEQEQEKAHLLHLANAKRAPSAGVPVYVMLPLDTITGCHSVNRRKAMDASLMALKAAGVEGVMVDVWWGLVERDEPGRYNWAGYDDLFDMVRSYGLKIQAVMSFHQCGGNVGDSCCIPLPAWVLEEAKKCPDIGYTDRNGRRNYEYISLGCDFLPVLRGRTPVQVYGDYMRSFRDKFKEFLGETIVEIQVGMGPAGELRYPSYPESNDKWRFPGIGEFQCYDKFMLGSLRAAAEKVGKTRWGLGGPSDSGNYNNWPEDTDFFRMEGGWNSPYGRFFLEWYSSMLLFHGERVLSAAQAVFRNTGVKLSGKVAGIHWHYGTHSHASELTAGYYNTLFRNGYVPIARMFARHGVVLNFTCIEMRDSEHPREARCSPEGLVRQVVWAARDVGAAVAGENALSRHDQDAYRQIIKSVQLQDNAINNANNNEPMCAFTFLRMNQQLFQSENWRRFVQFVRHVSEGNGTPAFREEATESTGGPFVHQAAEAALAHS